MDKQKILEKYKNENDKLLISKLFDKIGLTEKQNKIQVTDFYSPIELEIVKNVLNTINYKNYEIHRKRARTKNHTKIDVQRGVSRMRDLWT